MIGAIVGDVVGSAYEFRPIRHKQFPWFVQGCGITDDTLCTVAIADALLNQRNPAEALRWWAFQDFKLKGGYGKRFIMWLGTPDAPGYGSFGNGGAMRVSPVAWLARNENDLMDTAIRVTEVSHNHPEGIKGACATALSIWLARQGYAVETIRTEIETRFDYDLHRTVDAIRPGYKRTETAPGSVPESIICALEASSFEDAVRNAVSLGGDADTMASIAGSIAEARFGVPAEDTQRVWGLLPEPMQDIVTQFWRVSHGF